jgi:hypothetical protein
MAPTDVHRSIFSSDLGTAHRMLYSSSLSLPTYLPPSDTAISSDDPVNDRHPSIASSPFNSSTSPSQSRNSSWPFPSRPSPSTHSSPSSYPLPGHSNHPSPADSAHSPPNMIGATPTFYDPELEPQPTTQDYPDWRSTYGQTQLPLTTSPSSYPHQHSSTDPHPDSQAHPPPQHHDRYQFVNQPPPSTSSDATQFPYFPSFVDSSNSLSQAMRPQGWSAPQSSVYPQASTPNNTYIDLMSHPYPTTYDTTQSQPQHLMQSVEQVPGLAVTPASDPRVSPASASNALPSPGSSHTPTRPALVHPNSKSGSKSRQRNSVRKRPKPESDDEDDEDVLSASNVSRPNPNRL